MRLLSRRDHSILAASTWAALTIGDVGQFEATPEALLRAEPANRRARKKRQRRIRGPIRHSAYDNLLRGERCRAGKEAPRAGGRCGAVVRGTALVGRKLSMLMLRAVWRHSAPPWRTTAWALLRAHPHLARDVQRSGLECR